MHPRREVRLHEVHRSVVFVGRGASLRSRDVVGEVTGGHVVGPSSTDRDAHLGGPRPTRVPAKRGEARAEEDLAEGFAEACRDVADWPLPGGGVTQRRFDLLAGQCRADIALGRLVEAHADAVAIHVELAGVEVAAEAAAGGRRWGVWAAGPPESLRGHRAEGTWRVVGLKRWCSGASLVTHALVDAATDDGQQLFAVDLSDPGVRMQPPDWVGAGMARTDTRAVRFSDVPALPIGEAGSYVDRPGFWAGAIGVAACWHGGTCAIADALWPDGSSPPDPHRLAHMGGVHVALVQNQAMLEAAARRLDEEPDVTHPSLARAVRATVATNATGVIDRVGRALGPVPLAFDRRHAQAVHDLQVYVRQEHAERDLEQLGRGLLTGQARWTL